MDTGNQTGTVSSICHRAHSVLSKQSPKLARAARELLIQSGFARVSLIDSAIPSTSSTQGIQQMKRKKDAREEITLIGFVDPLDDDDDNTGVKISTDIDEYI
ncbi:MAG: hypothetical protein WBN03_21985, partial [Desulfobacterales bacterium]